MILTLHVDLRWLMPLFFVLAITTPEAASGAEYYVATNGSDTASGTTTSPFATIQKGINTAVNGDTVWVKPGTYSGSGNRAITLNGKQISIRSEEGPASTIIDCGRQQAFIAQNGERKTTYISGFTIMNGFVTNSRDWSGLGIIHMENTSITVESCIFHTNEVSTGRSTSSAGIIVKAEGNEHEAVVNNCLFYNNTISGIRWTGVGGGSGALVLSVGASFLAKAIRVNRCTIINNTISSSGGHTRPVIVGYNGDLGGVYNTIVWGNTTPFDPGGTDSTSTIVAYLGSGGVAKTGIISYCLASGTVNPATGPGNVINQTPLFLGGGTSLADGSPGKDAGDPGLLDPDGTRLDIGFRLDRFQGLTNQGLTKPPEVSGFSVADTSASGATLGGNVTSDGGASITERGVVYSITSINSDPLINGTGVTKLKATGSTGSFTIPVTGLIQGTNYSGKAYATNIQGTSYSSISNFTTLSTNAELSALTLSRGTLTPAFASPTIAYTATVSNATTSINVTPTRAQANATIEVRVNGGTYAMVTSGSASPALALNVGLNIVDVRVTAQAGNTKTYTLNVRVNHSPTLSGPSTVAMIEDGQETLAWSVADVDTDINALTLAAAATTNPTLLPLGRVTFSGSGAARMVTIDPVKGQSGTATITITVSDSLDSTSATLAVTVHEKDIVISRQPQSQEVSEQSEARFSVQLHSGGELATYQWFRNNQLLPGSTSSELVLSSVLLSQSGYYHVVITSPYDAETSISAPLVVRVQPEIKQQPNSVMVNVGDRANFAVSALGRPVLNYQWLRNGSNVSGAQAASFAINSTTMAQAGRYQVRITNPANPKGTLSAEAELGVVEAKGSMRLLEMPHSKVLKLSVAAAGNGLSYRWHRNGSEVTANGRTKGWDSKDLTLENISDADNGEYQCQVTGPGGVAWGAVTKVVVFMPPVITQQPESVMANVWDASGFAVFASGDPVLTYQWRHNGKVLTGSRSNILNIPVTMAHAGRYQLMINNPPNQIGILSAEVELGVVEAGWPSRSLKLQKGKMLKLTVAAAGNGLTYRWHRNGDANALTSRATGWATRKLIVENLTNADEGDYQCEVSGPGGTAWGAVTTLAVFEQKPKIQRPLLLNDAMVGKNYEFMVPLDLDNGGEATSYSASGLPPGLKIDASSGLISGKPTVAKAEGYFVKVTASNSLGKDEETTGLVVAPLRPGTTGTYAAIIRPVGWQINAQEYEPELYGRLDLTVLGTAAYSGSLTLGGKKLPVRGVLNTHETEDPVGVIKIKRTDKPDIEIFFTLIPDAEKPHQLIGGITGAGELMQVGLEMLGWRQYWNSSVNASAFDGLYNLVEKQYGWDIFEERTDLDGKPAPGSAGYLSFTVSLNGSYKMTGRTGDGEKVTCSGFLSEPSQGVQAPLYAYINSSKGCLAGTLEFRAESMEGEQDALAWSDMLSWNRAAGSASSRLYKAGFSDIKINMTGGQYVPPVKGEPLLDSVLLPMNLNNAKLDFDGAGASNQPAIIFSILEDGKIVIPSSATKTTLSITAATGMFKGSFVLTELNPFTKNGAPQPLSRTVKYEGLIVPNHEINPESPGRRAFGGGFFVLPQMPGSVTETLSNTPISGGRVTIKPMLPQ